MASPCAAVWNAGAWTPGTRNGRVSDPSGGGRSDLAPRPGFRYGRAGAAVLRRPKPPDRTERGAGLGIGGEVTAPEGEGRARRRVPHADHRAKGGDRPPA
ncbi:hypothetical protein GCM10010260_40230 [Streptomyces filipinensis]|uniref:Uncharacterized protein n=1 Tax=Streptomyces filipinensis TaxID=66887 RepID=A0A918ID35_9ACTN|nr:hypothetical protein GCM10010260_40230 [Streptomyces filipinensis]